MKFKNLFLKTVKYFPSEIDISDGKYIEKSGGFYFKKLSDVWNIAESHSENDWENLLVWTIFTILHKDSIHIYKHSQIKFITIENILNPQFVEKKYLEALHEEGYEDMLAKYLDNNEISI